jgi:hypothetical protein
MKKTTLGQVKGKITQIKQGLKVSGAKTTHASKIYI